jgi:hypothetical protein
VRKRERERTFVIVAYEVKNKYLIQSTTSTAPATDKPTKPIKVATPFRRT